MSTNIPVDERLTVLSLGAGVQSSTLALMCARGEIPMPELAIFADTQNEPASVYAWLEWLEKRLPFPVVRVTAGNLARTASRVRISETGNKYLKPMIPAYIANGDGSKGHAARHCTKDFKIDLILREMRKRRSGRMVHQYIGISFDELHRMKASKLPWLHNEYPLVERRITREHCLEWMDSQGFPRPPRSACVYCPFHSDAEWKRLRDEEPSEFAEAVRFEKRYQDSYARTALTGVPYLHASRQPLETVEFTGDPQIDAFGNECEGMCGV